MEAGNDVRVEKTRSALMSALTQLVFAKGFENVNVSQIVAAAGTGRSTFYEHFRSKEDLLSASMAQFLREFASAAFTEDMPWRLPIVLDHLWSNRRLTDAIFTGAARAVLARSLARMIEMKFVERAEVLQPRLPPRLVSIHLAEAQLALVEAWLRGRGHCSTEVMAQALSVSSRASARALVA